MERQQRPNSKPRAPPKGDPVAASAAEPGAQAGDNGALFRGASDEIILLALFQKEELRELQQQLLDEQAANRNLLGLLARQQATIQDLRQQLANEQAQNELLEEPEGFKIAIDRILAEAFAQLPAEEEYDEDADPNAFGNFAFGPEPGQRLRHCVLLRHLLSSDPLFRDDINLFHQYLLQAARLSPEEQIRQLASQFTPDSASRFAAHLDWNVRSRWDLDHDNIHVLLPLDCVLRSRNTEDPARFNGSLV
ncbi:hypothetical protein QOT17_000700 [Balamuthia mandrillaris]